MSGNKFLLRLSALLLALALWVPVLSSCGQTAENETDAPKTETGIETQNVSETESAPLDKGNVLDRFDPKDVEGYTLRIWTSNVINSSLTVQQAPYDTLIGDLINDALFDRDGQIKDTFHVDLEYTLVEPDSDFQLFNQASVLIESGDDEIDLIFGNMRVYAVQFINASLIHDMSRVSNIDLTREWWNQTARRDLTIAGSNYFATGDITPRAVFSTFLILFNKSLFTERGFESPYETVRAKKWTMSYLMELIEGQSVDLNSDDKWDLNDFYGFTNEGMAYPFYNGFDGTLISLATDEPVFLCEDELSIDKMSLVSEFFRMDDVMSKTFRTQYDSLDLFKADQALLTTQTACNLFMTRDMVSDYGVLPLPLYDDSQEEYHSNVNGYCATAIMMPITLDFESLAKVGLLTEALAALSHFTVTPAAYEKTLMTKQVRDTDSVEMMKISTAGAMYDLNLSFNFGNISSIAESFMLGRTGEIASQLASVHEKAEAEAQELLELCK